MTIIGLCGGSGSGKTTAAAVMSSEGAAVIDTDRVYRELCVSGSPCLRELEHEFGQGIIAPDGALDRASLAKLVFDDAKLRLRLNGITYKYIRAETERLISLYADRGAAAVVVDAPLLFESGFDALCNITVGVTAKKELRIKRIVARDGISAAAAEKRIASQCSDDELRSRCDTIIENDGDADSFADRVRSFYTAAAAKGGG